MTSFGLGPVEDVAVLRESLNIEIVSHGSIGRVDLYPPIQSLDLPCFPAYVKEALAEMGIPNSRNPR